MKKAVVFSLIVGIVAGFTLAAISLPLSAQTIPPARYQVISDMLTMQSDIDALKTGVAEAKDAIAVLELLRAHDVLMADNTRAADLNAWRSAREQDNLRISAVELAANDLYTICLKTAGPSAAGEGTQP